MLKCCDDHKIQVSVCMQFSEGEVIYAGPVVESMGFVMLVQNEDECPVCGFLL